MSFTTAQRALQGLSNRFLGLTILGIRTGGHYCSYALDAGTQDEDQLAYDQPTQSLLNDLLGNDYRYLNRRSTRTRASEIPR